MTPPVCKCGEPIQPHVKRCPNCRRKWPHSGLRIPTKGRPINLFAAIAPVLLVISIFIPGGYKLAAITALISLIGLLDSLYRQQYGAVLSGICLWLSLLVISLFYLVARFAYAVFHGFFDWFFGYDIGPFEFF